MKTADTHKKSPKQRIAYQFSKAAAIYDGAANIQLDIGLDALQMLPDFSPICVDIGCGTGRLTQHLAKQSEQVLALDLAEGMSRYAQVRLSSEQSASVSCITADVEQLPLASQSIDTVFSSMALQWCNPLDKALNEVYRVLKPGGQAVLALLCEGSMKELSTSWEKVDAVPRVNRFLSHQAIVNAAQLAQFNVKHWCDDYTTWHQDLRELLASVRSIGANVVVTTNNQQPLNRNSLARLEQTYKATFAQDLYLPLTYAVSFLKLSK